jgi:hypothetical protein
LFAEALTTGGAAATTNGDGQYVARDLAPGQYTVQFGPCQNAPYADQWYKDKDAGQPATVITVRPGRTTGGINARLNAGTSVSGLVESGATHQPAGDACVAAIPAGTPTAELGLVGLSSAPAGRKGRFTLTHLATGSYELIASECDGQGAVVQLPLRVPDRKSVVVTLPQPGTISGVVTAPAADGGGAGICVVATPTSGDGIGGVIAPDSSGAYSIPELAPGSYQVQFTPECVTGAAALATQTSSLVTVTAGGTTTVNASLAEVGSITGTVTTARAVPVAGECVAAFPTATATTPSAVAITSADGSYQIGFLGSGSYLVRFSSGCGGSGYATQWWDGVASATGAAPVSVAAGTATPDVNAVLAP